MIYTVQFGYYDVRPPRLRCFCGCFQIMNKIRGPFTIDHLANCNNRRIVRFNSLLKNSDFVAVDGFFSQKKKSPENTWRSPLFLSILRTI